MQQQLAAALWRSKSTRALLSGPAASLPGREEANHWPRGHGPAGRIRHCAAVPLTAVGCRQQSATCSSSLAHATNHAAVACAKRCSGQTSMVEAHRGAVSPCVVTVTEASPITSPWGTGGASNRRTTGGRSELPQTNTLPRRGTGIVLLLRRSPPAGRRGPA